MAIKRPFSDDIRMVPIPSVSRRPSYPEHKPVVASPSVSTVTAALAKKMKRDVSDGQRVVRGRASVVVSHPNSAVKVLAKMQVGFRVDSRFLRDRSLIGFMED